MNRYMPEFYRVICLNSVVSVCDLEGSAGGAAFYVDVAQRDGFLLRSKNERRYSESSDAVTDAAEKDAGVIELDVQIELETETEIFGVG